MLWQLSQARLTLRNNTPSLFSRQFGLNSTNVNIWRFLNRSVSSTNTAASEKVHPNDNTNASHIRRCSQFWRQFLLVSLTKRYGPTYLPPATSLANTASFALDSQSWNKPRWWHVNGCHQFIALSSKSDTESIFGYSQYYTRFVSTKTNVSWNKDNNNHHFARISVVQRRHRCSVRRLPWRHQNDLITTLQLITRWQWLRPPSPYQSRHHLTHTRTSNAEKPQVWLQANQFLHCDSRLITHINNDSCCYAKPRQSRLSISTKLKLYNTCILACHLPVQLLDWV